MLGPSDRTWVGVGKKLLAALYPSGSYGLDLGGSGIPIGA
jgi:hypothetical protein